MSKPVSDEERAQWRKTAELLIEHGGPGWHWTERQLRLLADLEREEKFLTRGMWVWIERKDRARSPWLEDFGEDHTHGVYGGDPIAVRSFHWSHPWEPNLAEAIRAIQEGGKNG